MARTAAQLRELSGLDNEESKQPTSLPTGASSVMDRMRSVLSTGKLPGEAPDVPMYDDQGNLIPTPTPTGVEPGGFIEAVKEGFGEGPVGPSEQTKAVLETPSPLGTFNKYITEPAMTAGEVGLRSLMAAGRGIANIGGKAVGAVTPKFLQPYVGTGQQFEGFLRELPEALPTGVSEVPKLAGTTEALKTINQAGKELRAAAKTPEAIDAARAKRVMSRILPGGATIQNTEDQFVPGFNPLASQTTEDMRVKALEKQFLSPEEIAARNAENTQSVKTAISGLTPEADIGASVAAAQEAYNAPKIKAAEDVTASRDILEASLKDIKTIGEDITPSVISTAATNRLQGIAKDVATTEHNLFETAKSSNPKIKIIGNFKKTLQNFVNKQGYVNQAGDVSGVNVDVLRPYMEDINNLDKYVPMSEIQAMRSKILSDARGASSPNEARLLYGFATEMLDQAIPSIAHFNKGKIGQDWKAAIDFAKNRRELYGNHLVGNIFDEDKVIPGAVFNKIFSGKADQLDKIKALKAVAPGGAGQSLDPVLTEHATNWLTNNLVDTVGLDSPEKFNVWKKKYQDVFNEVPEIANKFKTPESAFQSYSEALQNERAATAVKSKGALQSVMESGQDADAVRKSFNRIIKSPNSVEDAKKLIGYIGDNKDAMNGARRTFVESMLDSSNPHEFINQNRQVLNMFLDNPVQQKMLDKIARTSEVISNTAKTPSGKNKVAAKLLDPENYLTALVGVKKAAAIYGAAGLAGLTSGAIAYKLGLPIAESGILEATGIAGAVKSPQIVRYMYNAQREKVVDTITDAFLHPDQGRMLLENMNDVNNKKYVPRIMSGIVDSNLFAKGAAIAAAVPRYAAGGPVYTHPAISSIRAKRAMRSFSR